MFFSFNFVNINGEFSLFSNMISFVESDIVISPFILNFIILDEYPFVEVFIEGINKRSNDRSKNIICFLMIKIDRSLFFFLDFFIFIY